MIDYTKIRAHEGSQNNGFEELVCQLAHLQKPETGRTFIRKEGAGGDAGIECCWKLEDGSEIGWQAKYFVSGMDNSRWQQLDESFRTALEKHPNLTKYIVSLPLNMTDSRKKGRGGKQVVSIQDEWDARIVAWSRLAKEQGREIEFEFWGKHKLELLLTIDDPLYSGRALYWFNEPVLGFDIFQSIARISRDSLGERYTPEFHVDLPITKRFDSLCASPEWWARIKKKKEKLVDQKEKFFEKFLGKDYEFLDRNQVEQLEQVCSNLIILLAQCIKQKSLMEHIDEIRNLCEQIQIYQRAAVKEDKKDIFHNEEFNDEYRLFQSFFYEYRDFLSFLNSRPVKAGEVRAALIYGEAGIGKSHLLCDMSLHRLEGKLPTVFLLGQHYEGNDPIQTLKNALDLSSHSNKQVLGALDAAGEVYKTQVLIIVDAINEGNHRDDWHNHIRAFLSEVSAYKNVSILLSCRTTYLDYILPDSINDDCLIKIQHTGFQGYEHRAAEKYMSKQGISKPSAPILAPEFTNPLFLKACCRALKDSGLKSFPKGMQGLTRVFDFYLQSVEKTVARRKKYTWAEEIIKYALIEFASKIFPDNLYGLPVAKARSLINGFDPNPNRGDGLFDELISEGVLSEDISYDTDGEGIAVIRFTYERFSDHFVSQQIINQYDDETIRDIFSKEQPLGKIIEENGYYRFEGILEAMAIIIAEKFSVELIDLIPEELTAQIDDWVISQMFAETVIWRSASSFTERTLEVLNELTHHQYGTSAHDVLLKLSTEPNHPWNVNLLHKNLINKSMAERDNFWSIHIAFGDQVEEDGEPESILRTLIEWSGFGEIENIEEERARLCAITLLWFLTTSNRKVRDQATKSLVRLLCAHPQLLPALLKEFHHVDDLYLVERLYAVTYGVVCNIEDKSLISEIASLVYNLVFEDGEPIPHILLRDYARGVLEYALRLGLFPGDIDPETFRPPYKSDWPIENPSKEDIDAIDGDEFSSHIKSSLMGFPGDFGNYTMSRIHDWSPTPLSEPNPKTGYEYKKEFAENFLEGEIKEQYLQKIKPKKTEPINISDIVIEFKSADDEDIKKQRDEEKSFREKIEENLNDVQKEYYRWLSSLNNHRPAAFSRKWAQRWVCMRAHELGWTKELFDGFEKRCSYGRGGGPSDGYMERIGKKYQWIALHELLARLSDNVHWIDRGYSDIEDEQYYGPWQMHKRDIDPTIWIRSSAEKDSFYNQKTTWWQNYQFPLDGITGLDKQLEFLWSEQIIPDFSKTLEVSDSKQNGNWLALNGFWIQKQQDDPKLHSPRLDAWFRINSIVVKKSDVKKVREAIHGKNFLDPHTVNVPSTQHQGFLGEYPWHPSCRFMGSWSEDDWRELIPVKYMVPASQYEWEKGGTDHSLENSLSFYMPAADLINDLKLSRLKNNFGNWVNDQGEEIFSDPSIVEQGPSFALIKKQAFLQWLDENDLEIFWLIGGEKQLFETSSVVSHTFYGRLEYNALCRFEASKISADLWFKKQEPEEVV